MLTKINSANASNDSLRGTHTDAKGAAMKRMSLLIILFLAGCAADGYYPMSGAVCHADDPVLTMHIPGYMAPLPG